MKKTRIKQKVFSKRSISEIIIMGTPIRKGSIWMNGEDYTYDLKLTNKKIILIDHIFHMNKIEIPLKTIKYLKKEKHGFWIFANDWMRIGYGDEEIVIFLQLKISKKNREERFNRIYNFIKKYTS